MTGYAALGNSAPSNILLGFGGAPVAVTILANLMVLTHMLSAYQVRKHQPRLRHKAGMRVPQGE